MIFIVGPRRSGTSLCRALLGSHNRIIIPPNDLGVVELSYKLYKLPIDGAISKLKEEKKSQQWKFDYDLLKNQFSEVENVEDYIKSIYDNFFRNSKKDNIRIVKRPTYEKYSNLLESIYPNIKYIKMVRDPRAVVASRIDFKKDKINDISKYTNNFIQLYNLTKDFPKDKILFVKYENLVNDTENELKIMCDFIGIEYDRDMIDFYKNWGLDENQSSYKVNNNRVIYKESLDRWKTRLNRREKMFITRMTEDIIKREGYD